MNVYLHMNVVEICYTVCIKNNELRVKWNYVGFCISLPPQPS